MESSSLQMSSRVPRVACLLLAVTVLLVLDAAAPATAEAGNFRVACSLSHRNSDDPIVFPGQPGAAHRHDMFGALTTHAGSTEESLRSGQTSCSDRGDTAAYWHPTMYVRGRAVRGTMTVYYRAAVARRTLRPPPAGLKVVAGSHMATRPQPRSRVFFTCVRTDRPQAKTRRFNDVRRCRPGQHLAAWVIFPDCWDGERLDSPDHRSHLAYHRRGRCPASHPVALAQVIMRVDWPVRPWPGAVRFSSGARTTFHADFWNTWRQARLQRLTRVCVRQRRACGLVQRGR